MKIQWCWRCKRNVPMLDEKEWARVWRLHVECIRAEKKAHESSRGIDAFRDAEHALAAAWEHATGEPNDYPFTCMKHRHRISARGGPCPRCGKVLRTSAARQCFECDWCSEGLHV